MPEPTSTAADQPSRGSRPRLLLVTGPGRSGTSAVTGALSQLGVHVPPPLVDWNRSNKKGFFETRWVVDFQRKVLHKAFTYEFDADPAASKRVEALDDPSIQTDLTEWLKTAATGHEQMVIKDPRSIWLHPWWSRAAEDNDLVLSFLTMLRHPTEVVGSRSTYYGKFDDDRAARDYAISKVAGWVNVSLLNERMTRGEPRVYLRYTDLLADWRAAMTRVAERTDLTYNVDLTDNEPNPVDEFITPSLHRIKTSWEELQVPDALREIADEVWAACEQLADDAQGDHDAIFDQLSERYDRLYRDAAAIASDTTISTAARARTEGARKARRDLQSKIKVAKKAASEAEQKASAATRKAAAVTRQAAVKNRPAPVRQARRLARRTVRTVRRRLGR